MSRLIQGKSVVEALAIVDLSPRKAAALIGKTLRSAIASDLFIGEPAGIPIFGQGGSQTDRINFLSHDLFLPQLSVRMTSK